MLGHIVVLLSQQQGLNSVNMCSQSFQIKKHNFDQLSKLMFAQLLKDLP